MGQRVVVIGATGNVGTSVLEALGREPLVDEIVGVARRRPELEMPKTRWAEVDVADRDGLVGVLRGANAAIHLAWAIQPSRDEATLARINIEGSERTGVGARQ